MFFHQRKYSKILTIVLFGLHSQVSLAANQLANMFSPFFVTVSAGPGWENGGKTQTFYLTPDIVKTYDADNSTNAFMNGEIFFGIQKNLQKVLQGQLGISVASSTSVTLAGNIWDDADPEFNNYTYSYRIRHTMVGLKGKLLADMGYIVTPWISGSVGVGFNQAFSFNNTPTIPEAVQSPPFSSNTTTTFAYTLGVGVQKSLTKNWQVGIGYEFSDWGKSQLGRASGQTLGNGLTLNHLYTSEVLLDVTYLA